MVLANLPILQAQSNPLPLAKSNELHHVLLPRAGGQLARDGNSSSEGPPAPPPLHYGWEHEKRSDKTTEAFLPWSQPWLQVAAALALLATEPPILLGPPALQTQEGSTAGAWLQRTGEEQF